MLKPWEQTRTGTPCKPQVEPLELTLCKPEAGSHPEGLAARPKPTKQQAVHCTSKLELYKLRLTRYKAGLQNRGRAKTESTEKLKEDLQAVRWSSCSMPWSCAASHATSHLLPVMAGPQGPSQTLSHNRETPLALLLEGCGESRGECTNFSILSSSSAGLRYSGRPSFGTTW